ncbi:MAG TPA: hypothetical protein VN796_02025 [Acidimicrobiales bacterium]|nr:hypothetical protein [Acidimicrobiales bacterium]
MLDRWDFRVGREPGNLSHNEPETFRRLTRDLYIPPGGLGFWEGTFRDTRDPVFAAARDAVTGRLPLTVDLLYRDHEGGQRTISRFTLLPGHDDQWITSIALHWNLDRADPR